jgi:hypothetical protein
MPSVKQHFFHYDRYQRTCRHLMDAIRQGQFSPLNAPRIVESVKIELWQCVALNLLSVQQAERLQAMLGGRERRGGGLSV